MSAVHRGWNRPQVVDIDYCCGGIIKANCYGSQVFYVATDQHISGVLTDMLEPSAEPHTEAD